MTERSLLSAAMLRWPHLFRNDCGVGFRRDGSRFRYGLQPGSGDLIGWEVVQITPDMIGQKIARFLSVECKTKNDRIREDQRKWHDAVNAAGGRAIFFNEKDL